MEDIKQKRVEYIQEMIFKYTTTEPKLNSAELAYAFLFHLDSEEFLKAIKKEAKSKW